MVVVVDLEIEVAQLVFVLDSSAHGVGHYACGFFSAIFIQLGGAVLEIFVGVHSRDAF